MKIGELARRAGVRTSAVRYYERLGLLPEAPRAGGQRQYEPRALKQLAVIELCQQAGFTLDEIALLLRDMEPGRSLSRAWKSMAQRKIEELDERIARITTMRQLLVEGLRCECLSLSDCELTTRAQEERTLQGTQPPRGAPSQADGPASRRKGR